MIKSPTKPFNFLQGGGEMGAYTRSKNWSETIIGPPESWPQVLKTTLSNLLNSRFPMFLWWGPELICFYNDAYRPSLGNEGKHPQILGMPAREAWTEIWEIIHPLIQQVLETGEATWSEDQLIPIFRNGHIEDVYWTFSYSRVNNENGEPAGVLVTCTETTDKVITLRKLEDSKDQLEFAIEAAELGTWDYNPITNQFSANQRLKEWFGFNPEDSIDLTKALDCMDEADRPRVVKAIQHALNYSSGGQYNITYTIINAITKVEKIVRVKGKAYFNDSKNAYRFNGTMEDITDETRTRKDLEASERNYRYLIEHAPVAMCVMSGPDHVVDIANEKIFELWGRRPEEVMHKPLFEGLPEARSQGYEELLEQVLRTGERITIHEKETYLNRTGTLEKIYVDFVFDALEAPDGHRYAVVAVAIETTEQVMSRQLVEEAEERVRLAIEAGDMGTFDFNTITKETVTSDKFNQIFGLPRNAKHADYLARIHPDDLSIRQAAIDEATRSGKLFYEVRLTPTDKDDSLKWIRVEGKVIFEDNKPVRLLGTLVDLTAIREADQKKEEYIAIASHELRNPLTSLKLSLDLLTAIAASDSANFEMLLGKAKSQVQKLVTLTNELLNVSKISAGSLELKMDILNVENILKESIQTFLGGGFKNEVVISGKYDFNIKADKFRIEQVLINLLTNAAKYSPEGSPIEIAVNITGSVVKISIRDQGIGIDAEKIPHIFKKFTRVDSSDSITGFGLGLYISDQIVHKHGGIMGVESEKGKGSIFWFTLPY